MKVAFLSCAHVHTLSYVESLKKSNIVDEISLFDYSSSEAKEFSRKNGIKFHDNITEALNGADGAIICAANADHLKYIEEVVKYNVPILCEKPLTTTKEHADMIGRLLEDSGVSLYMAQPVRYTRQAFLLRQMIRSKAFGDIVSLSGTNHGSLPDGWFRSLALTGGGAIMDHGPHVIDLIRWATGHEVSSIYAVKSNKFKGLEIEDAALLSMEMDDGALSFLDPSYSRGPFFPTWGDVTLNVEGTKLSAYFDFLGNRFDQYSLKSKNPHAYIGYDTDMDYNMILDYLGILRNRDNNKHSMLATFDDGYRELMVLLTAYRSARVGTKLKVEL